MWYLLALLSGFLAAILAIVVKVYLKNINPLFITFVFSLFAIVFLFIYDLFTNQVNCKLITSLGYKEWTTLVIAGCLNLVAFSCYVMALKCGKTGGVVAIDRLGIIFTLILATLFLQETISTKAIFGSILMIVGSVLISLR